MTISIFIDEKTGELEGIYSDELSDLLKEAMPDGKMSCPLASELIYSDELQEWEIHTIKYGVLKNTFRHYSDARDHEVKFLTNKLREESINV